MMTFFTRLGSRVRTWIQTNRSPLTDLGPRLLLSVLGVGAFALGDGFDRTVWLYEHTGITGLVLTLALSIAATLVAMDGAVQVMTRFRRR